MTGQGRDAIADREIGMRLRDVFWQDANGIIYEMSRIQPDDRSHFQYNSTISQVLSKFYLEGNEIVLMPNFQPGTGSGNLLMTFYLRPNILVPNTRACIAQSFDKNITIGNLIDGDYLQIDSQTYVARTSPVSTYEFAIGVDSTASALNLANKINSLSLDYSAISTLNVCKVTAFAAGIVYTAGASNYQISSNLTINFDQVPTSYTDPDTFTMSSLFSGGEYIDFLQTKSGHRTYSYDVRIPASGISGNSITFPASSVPLLFVKGDYIALANECIIPQIPTDFHNGLAERTSARILAAQGDKEGLATANEKIQQIVTSEGKILDNRVEGSPEKILARHSLLRAGKYATMKWRN